MLFSVMSVLSSVEKMLPSISSVKVSNAAVMYRLAAPAILVLFQDDFSSSSKDDTNMLFYLNRMKSQPRGKFSLVNSSEF